MGMFLDGAARWGFDSILQTAASLLGDGQSGSALPTFVTNSTNFAVDQSSIFVRHTLPSLLSPLILFQMNVAVEHYPSLASIDL